MSWEGLSSPLVYVLSILVSVPPVMFRLYSVSLCVSGVSDCPPHRRTVSCRNRSVRMSVKFMVVIVTVSHLFPFRTEKLSPSAPMVLPTSGRVGSRRPYRGESRSGESFRTALFLAACPAWAVSLPWGKALWKESLNHPKGNHPQVGSFRMVAKNPVAGGRLRPNLRRLHLQLQVHL